MKAFLITIFAYGYILMACPVYSIEDSNYNDMKQAGKSVYNIFLKKVSRCIEDFNKDNKLKTFSAFLTLYTKLMAWLDFMREDDTKKAWQDGLNGLKLDLKKAFKDNKSLMMWKYRFILFYQFNPMESIETVYKTRDKLALDIVKRTLLRLKFKNPLLLEYGRRIKDLNMDGLSDFIKWQKRYERDLIITFGEYFERNPII